MITIERFIRAVFLGFLMANETYSTRENGLINVDLRLVVERDGKREPYLGTLTDFQEGVGTKVERETGIPIRSILKKLDVGTFIKKYGNTAGESGRVLIGEHELEIQNVVYGDQVRVNWKWYFGSR